MKIIIFKGIAPICFSGSFGEVVLKNGGVLNRVDDNVWKEVERAYPEVVRDFVRGGFIIFTKSKTGEKENVSDDEVANDENKEGAEKQNSKKKDAGNKE